MYTAEFKTAATQFFAAADTFAEAAGVDCYGRIDCYGIRIAIERTRQGVVLRAFSPLDGNLFTINRNDL